MRSVVLVTIDSLRADHCGFLGCERDATPHLDALAADGVAYEAAVAPGPRTPSSMPVAFTGEFGRATSRPVGDWRGRRRHVARHMARYPTLAERLSEAGHATAALTLNPWTRGTGFDAGFDRFRHLGGAPDLDSPGLAVVDRALRWSGLADRVNWDNKRDWFQGWADHYDAVRGTLDRLDAPFLCWVFLLDPHQPYVAPRAHRVENTAPEMYYALWRQAGADPTDALPRFAATRLRRAYRDAVRSTDAFLGRLRRDLPDDVHLVVHADHGEAFGEHGTYGHARRLYAENLRVPLVVSGPGVDAERVADPVSLARLSDLVADAAAERFDPGRYASDYVRAATETGGAHALRGRRWKYVRDGGEELYDLRADPGERVDLADDRPEVLARLRNLLADARRRSRERAAVAEAATALEGRG